MGDSSVLGLHLVFPVEETMTYFVICFQALSWALSCLPAQNPPYFWSLVVLTMGSTLPSACVLPKPPQACTCSTFLASSGFSSLCCSSTSRNASSRNAETQVIYSPKRPHTILGRCGLTRSQYCLFTK